MMSARARERLTLLALLGVALAVFLPGITWGLPSRRVDPFLFGDRPVWTGAQIRQLTESAATWDDAARGADVDADPLGAVTRPIVVNATDADRAQIVRRYRLFTYQPDEMITLMSLAKMRPGRGDLDPRLYQYGGLWIYPVGALLKAASVVGFVDLRGGPEGLTYYLDHPEAFGRFYVVARLYVVGWALVGVWAVFAIVRRVGGSLPIAAAGALAFILMPVVVNMAHEAKPHVPGAVLVLLAVLAGANFVQRGRWRDAALAGGLCGAALGMVLSTLPAFALLPLMALLRPMPWRRRAGVMAVAGLAGLCVYGMTNPYVILHLLRGGPEAAVFRSNLGNSSAMYQVGRPVAGLLNTASLLAEGMSLPLAVAGLVGAVALGWRAVRVRKDQSEAEVRRRATGLLLAVPAVLTLLQAALVGAGKPGEFGRFLLLPDVFLAIEAVAAAGTFLRPGLWRAATLGALLAATGVAGGVYLRGFVRDSRGVTSRLAQAGHLRQYLGSGLTRMAVVAEPAPYALPPVDLFRWKIAKLPNTTPQATADVADLFVRAVDESPGSVSTRISWADKPFEVRVLTGAPCCGDEAAAPPGAGPGASPTPPGPVP